MFHELKQNHKKVTMLQSLCIGVTDVEAGGPSF